MGCVLQPGDVISAAALQPGQTTSDAVQPGQEIDICIQEIVNLTNVTIQEFSTAPAIGDKEAGYEVQVNGNVFSVTNEDNGAGPPTFLALNSLTDWIDNKSYVLTYHARMNKTGGAGVLGAGSSPENVWREIGVDSALWLLQEGNGAGSVSWNGLIEISDDGGSTTLDSATITLETNEV